MKRDVTSGIKDRIVGQPIIIDREALENKYLIESSQSAFELEYLIEVSASIEINSANFEGLTKQYNRQHNGKLPYDLMKRRIELNRKRLSEAYFLFAYLELGQRYKIPRYYIIEKDLDQTILKHKEKFQEAFRERWTTKHECEKEGCGEALIIDGGLKPHR